MDKTNQVNFPYTHFKVKIVYKKGGIIIGMLQQCLYAPAGLYAYMWYVLARDEAIILKNLLFMLC